MTPEELGFTQDGPLWVHPCGISVAHTSTALNPYGYEWRVFASDNRYYGGDDLVSLVRRTAAYEQSLLAERATAVRALQKKVQPQATLNLD